MGFVFVFLCMCNFFLNEEERKKKGHLSFPWVGNWGGDQPSVTSKDCDLLGPNDFEMEPALKSMIHELLSAGVPSTTLVSFGAQPALQLFVLT